MAAIGTMEAIRWDATSNVLEARIYSCVDYNRDGITLPSEWQRVYDVVDKKFELDNLSGFDYRKIIKKMECY